jgi:hypothetical protein
VLNRRFTHYRSPGKSQETNKWANAAMKRVLQAEGQVFVDIAVEILVEIDGSPVQPDQFNAFYRRLAENAALVAARQAGMNVRNL